MQEAAAVRRAALDAVDDIDPGPLCERIADRLEEGSMAPGVLTLLSARAVRRQRNDSEGHDVPALEGDESGEIDVIAHRGAGVQLIYEGLRLTRTLAYEEPWEAADGVGESSAPVAATNGAGGDLDTDPQTDADMAILAADVLVARGFYLLARTEAAQAAVDVVQSFGRDQTTRRVAGDESLDRNLEADVFELAVVAGTTTAGATPSADLREYAVDFAPSEGPLPRAETLFSDASVESLSDIVAETGEDVARSAD